MHCRFPRGQCRRVLRTRRANNDHWALISGMLSLGEPPARGPVRQIFEETAVVAEAERVVSVGTVGPFGNSANIHLGPLPGTAALKQNGLPPSR